VIYAFTVMICFVLILLLFCSKLTDYSYKRSFLAGNILLLGGGIVAAACLVLFRKKCGRILGKMCRDSTSTIRKLTLFLIPVQIYICYNAYFYTEWDVAMIIRETFCVVEGKPLTSVPYFSIYPNNILLLAVFSLIKKVDLYFGILDVQEGIMGIVCVQCVVSGVTGYMLFQILKELAGEWGAWLGWICYLVLVGSSGWLMIPYSDSMGLFFPTALLFLYGKIRSGKYVRLNCLGVGTLAFLGYHIKPQILITFIAMTAVELFLHRTCIGENMQESGDLRKSKAGAGFSEAIEGGQGKKGGIERQRKEIRLLGRGIWYVLAGGLLAAVLNGFLVRDIARQLDGEKAFGPAHFVMMGLNTEKNGAYLESDVNFSQSFATKAERTRGNLEVIGQRLNDMGGPGLGMHCVRKLLTNYGDGTFAWRQEGNFFSYIYEQKNQFISPALRNIIWGDGAANAVNETLKHGIWLCLLAASLGALGYRKQANPALCLVLLAIMGLTLFGLIFEARARYLYIYVPFYIISGVLGARKIVTDLLEALDKHGNMDIMK